MDDVAKIKFLFNRNVSEYIKLRKHKITNTEKFPSNVNPMAGGKPKNTWYALAYK